MGYRSDVFFKTTYTEQKYTYIMKWLLKADFIESYEYEELISGMGLVTNDFVNLTHNGEYIKLCFNSVKWYDAFEGNDIEEFENWFSEMKNEEYCFIVLGEEYDDILVQGDMNEMYMYINRTVTL